MNIGRVCLAQQCHLLFLPKRGYMTKKLQQQLAELSAENERMKLENRMLRQEFFVATRALEDLTYALKADHICLITDYPIQCRPRYTSEHPHPQLYTVLQRHKEAFASRIEKILLLKEFLMRIPLHEKNVSEPCWINNWISPLDSATLYAFIAQGHPKRFCEVGSGNSTKFARRAITDHHLKTEIISIDPKPRAEIDVLCDQCIRQPVEDLDVEMFKMLKKGDIFFIDGSHRTFQNSDVTALFLDIIPRLEKGVIVHLHDIFLPYDYPAEWKTRYYNEQYVLGAYLLAEGPHMHILQANAFISEDNDLNKILMPLWNDLKLSQEQKKGGSSFWFQTA